MTALVRGAEVRRGTRGQVERRGGRGVERRKKVERTGPHIGPSYLGWLSIMGPTKRKWSNFLINFCFNIINIIFKI